MQIQIITTIVEGGGKFDNTDYFHRNNRATIDILHLENNFLKYLGEKGKYINLCKSKQTNILKTRELKS